MITTTIEALIWHVNAQVRIADALEGINKSFAVIAELAALKVEEIKLKKRAKTKPNHLV